jgi:predicted MFS family arabinose efflux permease
MNSSPSSDPEEARPAGSLEPFADPVFRATWIGSVFFSFGLFSQNIGAAWVMTEIASAQFVALITTALMGPSVFLALFSGAMADMFDRRKVQIVAMALGLVSNSTLAGLAYFGVITPAILLLFTFFQGCALTLFGPSWQASTADQVGDRLLPTAISLNAISFNIGRALGPAIGGLLVSFLGPAGTFLFSAVFYLPMLVTLLLWKPEPSAPRLPPQTLGRTVQSGLRYVINSPPIRNVIIRCVLVGSFGGSLSALMPVLAREQLGGGASSLGLLLAGIGSGAIVGWLTLGRWRTLLSPEAMLRTGTTVSGLCLVAVSFSTSVFVTLPVVMVFGMFWLIVTSGMNIAVQVPSPRWAVGRMLATFQAAAALGMALAGILWGRVAESIGLQGALLSSGCLLVIVLFIYGLRYPVHDLRRAEETMTEEDHLSFPVDLEVTNRSGPVVVEIEYRVDAAKARDFYHHMSEVRSSRLRNGAYDWSLARDISNRELWLERYYCSTWLDYQHVRSRGTCSERDLWQIATRFHDDPQPITVRRRLERPYGSVRWKDETKDPGPRKVVGPVSGSILNG